MPRSQFWKILYNAHHPPINAHAFKFVNQYFECISRLSPWCCISCPSQPPLFYHPLDSAICSLTQCNVPYRLSSSSSNINSSSSSSSINNSSNSSSNSSIIIISINSSSSSSSSIRSSSISSSTPNSSNNISSSSSVVVVSLAVVVGGGGEKQPNLRAVCFLTLRSA
jgi:hypothetical protein